MRASTAFVATLIAWFGTDCASAAEPAWQPLLGEIDVRQSAVAGEWTKAAESLQVAAAQGARLVLPVMPTGEYDLRVSFTRQTGQHSIALIFVHGGKQATFEVDAWGSHLAGLQNIAGRSIRDNPTRLENIRLENGRRYTLTLEVRREQVRGLLDDRVIATHRTDGSDLSLLDVWSLREPRQIGIGAWESETVFHQIDVRPVSGGPIPLVRATTPTATAKSKTATPPPSAPPSGKAAGKRVLIVIANQHFFYREYGDPREELERAGVRVTVAAGRKATSRPHQRSGEGSDGGAVMPDIALADVKADDYDAVLFSGGWGASMYQFAFPGRYNESAYNGDRAVKVAANKVINDFLAQDKYVCALCNGVSVLAWARVNGQSPLAGKRVCAPTREAAAGIYNGRPGQPSCRWHPETNGAILSPPGSVGRPGTNVDDVLVDGRIITGEDDPSAREMGRKIVEVLSR